jgi:hypothetical protein
MASQNAPSISESDAIAIAKAYCEKRAWVWLDPILVTLQPDGTWHVRTHANARGSNSLIVVDQTGNVVEGRFAGR